MISEKELLEFDEETFIYVTYLKMKQEKDENQRNINIAIKDAEKQGFNLIKDCIKYGQNYNFAYDRGYVILVFEKDNAQYSIYCNEEKEYCVFDEESYMDYIYYLYKEYIITEQQLNIFKKAYYYTLKSNLEKNKITPIYENAYFDDDKLADDFFNMMFEEISFSEENYIIITDVIMEECFDTVRYLPLDTYKTLSNFCGLCYFSCNSSLDIKMENNENRNVYLDIEESCLNNIIYCLNQAESTFQEYLN